MAILSLLLLLPLSLAWGQSVTADAGIDQVLNLPTTELTLWGQEGGGTGPITVGWERTSGPAAVTFSEAAGRTVTATFTTAGTYTFRFSATDGTTSDDDTMQVTVNAESVPTKFYVDPTYTGGTANGQAATPWKTVGAINWSTINTALASNHVTMFFSARIAASDTKETLDDGIFVDRTDTGPHILTLDGMSKYNTNEASPSWADYTGSHKMHIATTGGSMALGWDDDSKRPRITLRGFEISGSGARVYWGGSYTVVERLWQHDSTGVGPTMIHSSAVRDFPDCTDLGKADHMTVRNNLIQRGVGEGIYIAGNYILEEFGGCISYGNTHSHVLIEGNTLEQTGLNGEQGDAIDIKAGITYVTIRGNTATGQVAGDGGGAGIVMEGTFDGLDQHHVFERNRFCDSTTGDGMLLGNADTIVVRNNILCGNAEGGIYFSGDDGFVNSAIVYNNTVAGNATGISLGYLSSITMRNNAVVANGAGNQIQLSGPTSGVSSNFNLLAPAGSAFTEGAQSIVQASTAGIFTNLASDDLTLVSGSPARNAGTALTSTGFSRDYAGVTRPQGAAWDIGAYEFVEADTTPPAAPTNLRVMTP